MDVGRESCSVVSHQVGPDRAEPRERDSKTRHRVLGVSPEELGQMTARLRSLDGEVGEQQQWFQGRWELSSSSFRPPKVASRGWHTVLPSSCERRSKLANENVQVDGRR